MSTGGYKIINKEAIHFVTFAITEWVDVFTRREYKGILIDSIKYCQKEKGLVLYAWCIMSNHVHLAAAAKGNNLSDILRDVKKYTAKQIIKAIEESKTESRKEWMLAVFKNAGAHNSRNTENQFWRQNNQPKEMYSSNFIKQKLDYIHNNPVEEGIVDKAEEYIYSSARDYYHGKKIGLLEIEWLW